jgi:nitroreductase
VIHDLVVKNRSYRRFHQEAAVSRDTLCELVDLARLSGSASNSQPLKYILACDPALNARIFPTLAWARHLKTWKGPEEGERPAAYIVILGDKDISQEFAIDAGIASQSILLGATEKGLGGCMIRSVDRPALRQALGIAERFEIFMVIALGKPRETVTIEPLPASGDTKYWRDDMGGHHVPKRALDEIIIG